LALFLRILVSVKRAAHDSFEFKIKEQIIMRGSSGIPKSDINSTPAATTTAPTTTGDTSAELKNSKESYQRQKTRKPPLVKGRQPAYLQDGDSKTSKALASKEMS